MPNKPDRADSSRRSQQQRKSEDGELTSQHPQATRREFLATTSTVALGLAVPSSAAQSTAHSSENRSEFSRAELFEPGSSRKFSGERATQVAMPVGGIGAGCVCLNGYGGLQDFSIWNHPATTALPEGFAPSKAAFAILHIKGAEPVTRLVEGHFPVLKIYDQGLQGEGYRRGGFEGFPRFAKSVFQGEYPIGEVKFTDSSIPIEVTLHAWNPFIPLDEKNSGIPCAILEYTLQSNAPHAIEYEFSYHLS